MAGSLLFPFLKLPPVVRKLIYNLDCDHFPLKFAAVCSETRKECLPIIFQGSHLDVCLDLDVGQDNAISWSRDQTEIHLKMLVDALLPSNHWLDSVVAAKMLKHLDCLRFQIYQTEVLQWNAIEVEVHFPSGAESKAGISVSVEPGVSHHSSKQILNRGFERMLETHIRAVARGTYFTVRLASSITELVMEFQETMWCFDYPEPRSTSTLIAQIEPVHIIAVLRRGSALPRRTRSTQLPTLDALRLWAHKTFSLSWDRYILYAICPVEDGKVETGSGIRSELDWAKVMTKARKDGGVLVLSLSFTDMPID